MNAWGDPKRSGVIAGGNFIVDQVKEIDRWPAEDSLARVLRESRHNGGGPFNLLIDLARLRAPFPLAAIGRVGNDSHGAWIRQMCREHGVDLAQLRTTADAATSYTDVMSVRATGRRTFFHQAGANAHLAPEHFEFTATAARFFYLGYLLLLDQLDRLADDGRPRAIAVLRHARAAGLVTVLDCVSDPGDRWATVVAPALPEVDVLLTNDYEAERLTGVKLCCGANADADAAATAARQLLTMGIRRLAVVHTPDGIWAASPDGRQYTQASVRVPPADVAGTAGAGDALAAGLLYGLHWGWTIEAALELAVCAAASSLRHPSASEAVVPADAALALGRRWGFGAPPS